MESGEKMKAKSSGFRKGLTVACMTILVLTAACIMPTIRCAEAALVDTESGSYSGGVTDGTNILVNQFNPALGTLTGATFTLTGTFAGTYSITNNSANNVTAYWGQLGSISISYGSMTLSSSASNPNLPMDQWYNGILQNNLNLAGTVAANGGTLTGPALTMNPSQTFTASGDLSAFIGTGQLPFLLVASQSNEVVVGGGNWAGGIDTAITGTVTAQYDYNSVPVPGAVWLLGSGLVGLVGFRRREKK